MLDRKDGSAFKQLSMRAKSDMSTPLLSPTISDGRQGDDGGHHNALGTINGCYVPCLLNIMGIILFIRLAWAVGHAGVGNILFMFAIAETMTFLTVLSLSAMITNGAMRGGGSYYMISRTLGPEFGGSVGILFWIAYAIGASFYITGFSEEVRNTWFSDHDSQWFIAGISSIVLAVTLIVSLGGAAYFTKVNVFLFIVQFAAIITALLAMFCRDSVSLSVEKGSFVPWSWQNVRDKWGSDWSIDHSGQKLCPEGEACSMKIVFGVLFPAATGIMEGANLSGDLKDPNFSIPIGTISAVITSIIFYILLIIGYAGCATSYALQNDLTIMQEISWSETFTVVGILVSTSSSALGALFGGSRVLQALARDEVFPYLSIFGYGTVKGDEPIYAVLLTWAVAQLCCLLGNLNVIAPVISSFFCLSYATVNLACFLLVVSGTPNFRPTWKWYSKWTSLLGFLMAIGIMFFLDYAFALAALSIETLIFVWLAYRAPATQWGDVSQSVIFHQVRKYLLRLDSRKRHNKLWRPSLLLLVDDIDFALIDFCNSLKKGGLYVIGSVVVGPFEEKCESAEKTRDAYVDFIHSAGIKAFPKVATGSTFRQGFQSVLMMGGLGAMVPNCVVLPLIETPIKKVNSNLRNHLKDFLLKKKELRKQSEQIMNLPGMSREESEALLKQPKIDITEFLDCVRDVLAVKKNLIITSNFEMINPKLLKSEPIAKHVLGSAMVGRMKKHSMAEKFLPFPNSSELHRIDCWINCKKYDWNFEFSQRDSGFPAFLMQMAFILKCNQSKSHRTIFRVILVDGDRHEASFLEIARLLRLEMNEIVCLEAPTIEEPSWPGNPDPDHEWAKRMNTLIRNTSADLSGTAMAFLPLPNIPPKDAGDDISQWWLDELLMIQAHVMCPIAFCETGEVQPVISTSM